jgi:hypothetical protein
MGLNTTLSASDEDERRLFEAVVDAYTRAVVLSYLDGADRLEAAERFRDLIDRLAARPQAAIGVATDNLHSDDDERANAAARVLAGVPDLRAAELLLAAYEDPQLGPRLDAEHLAQLGTASPVPPGLRDYAERPDASARDGAVRVLLRHPTGNARVLLMKLVTTGEWLGRIAVHTAARWGDANVLRAVADAHPPESSASALIAALTELAAAGDVGAIARLETKASAEEPAAASDACYALSQIAWPNGVHLVARLLRDPHADEALSAAHLLRAVALGPWLIDLIERRRRAAC